MAQSLEARLRAANENLDHWYRRKTEDIEEAKEAYRRAGLDAWHIGTKVGQSLVAATGSQLEALGRAYIGRPVPRGPTAYRTSPNSTHARSDVSRVEGSTFRAPRTRTSSSLHLPWRNGARQADRAVRSAANLLTLGLADKGEAALEASLSVGEAGDWGDRYKRAFEAQSARNADDAKYRPRAQTIGYIGGGLLGMAAGGPIVEGVAARYLAPSAALVRQAKTTQRLAPLGRGLKNSLYWSGVAGAGGAALGVSGRAALDFAERKASSPGSYAAAALAGAADGVATMRLGPGAGGAIGGGVYAATNASLNDRDVSVRDVALSALQGNLLGRGAGAVGTLLSHRLPSVAKGHFGEFLSRRRSKIEGDDIVVEQRYFELPERPFYPRKHKTRVDLVTAKGKKIEAKFGFEPTLSSAQLRAVDELPNYVVEHWLPRDAGKLFGGAVSGSNVSQMDRR